MKARLILVPTPITDELPFETSTLAGLKTAIAASDIIAVEEHKIARRKWLANGLPRECIDQFVVYNEHTRTEQLDHLIDWLKRGKNVYLMSDCGLPALCDPGQELVERCHQLKIPVTSLSFSNSIVLALALSGFEHRSFKFEGFIQRDDRQAHLRRCLENSCTTVLMDTPYRLQKLLQELNQLNIQRELCVAIDLNSENELIYRGLISDIVKHLNNINKREFVIILGPDERAKKTRSH